MPATWAWAAAKRLTIGSPQKKVILEVEVELKVEVEAVMDFAVTGVALNAAIVLEARISPADQEEALGVFASARVKS